MPSYKDLLELIRNGLEGDAAKAMGKLPLSKLASARKVWKTADISDRIVVVKRSGKLQEPPEVVQTLKGPEKTGMRLFLTKMKDTFAARPEAEDRWVLFLREDADGRGYPQLRGVRKKDWFFPASDELILWVRTTTHHKSWEQWSKPGCFRHLLLLVNI